MTDEYTKALAAEIEKLVKDGKKVILEPSNETAHLDLETGEWISDSYIEERIEIPPKTQP